MSNVVEFPGPKSRTDSQAMLIGMLTVQAIEAKGLKDELTKNMRRIDQSLVSLTKSLLSQGASIGHIAKHTGLHVGEIARIKETMPR